MVYLVNILVGAAEWGFLFRRYQVWNNYTQESVELDPYQVWNFYVYKYLLAIVLGFLLYGTAQTCLQRLMTFRGRWPAKRGITELEENNKEMNRDVKVERKSALRASKRVSKLLGDASLSESDDISNLLLDDSSSVPQIAIIVTKLQCWKSLSSKDIGPHNQQSVVQNQGWGKLGLYSVKGVSFCVNVNEKFVILGSASSGRTSLIKNILGMERILSG